jgi:hypothetical protein
VEGSDTVAAVADAEDFEEANEEKGEGAGAEEGGGSSSSRKRKTVTFVSMDKGTKKVRVRRGALELA